jgi:hypothetical protein
VRPLSFLCAVSALVIFLVACGDEGEGGDLEVTLSEFSVEIDEESLEEGPITFDIDNQGEREHELLIVRTDVAADELPVNDDGSVDEDAGGVDVQQEIEEIESGDDTSRDYTLSPGAYVLLCNIVEEIDGTQTSHYAEGMHTEFTVTEQE